MQDIFALRFSNGIFEPLWNRNYVSRVEITAAETIGVEERGGYYDHYGALRDMIQNHLLQVLGTVTIEPPSFFDATDVRNESIKIFQSLRPIKPGDVDKYAVRGQYTESVINGKKVLGYRQEKDVAHDSMTETFVALKLYIDNWRWGGVPFYLRTGKCLPSRVSEVVIEFKKTPHHLFTQEELCSAKPNQLIIRIQPDEGILLRFGMKKPGAGFDIEEVGMDFHYSELADTYIPEAYERLHTRLHYGRRHSLRPRRRRGSLLEVRRPYTQGVGGRPRGQALRLPRRHMGPPRSEAHLRFSRGGLEVSERSSDDGRGFLRA